MGSGRGQDGSGVSPRPGRCMEVDCGSPQARSWSLLKNEPLASEQPLCQGCRWGSSGPGQGPDPCGHVSMGNMRCSWRPLGRGFLRLESCRAAQEHRLRTDLLHHEIPSPATVGATSCNTLQKNYRFLAAFHVSSSPPPHLPEVSEESRVLQIHGRDQELTVNKQRWAAGEEGLTPQSLMCLWDREVSSFPLLF